MIRILEGEKLTFVLDTKHTTYCFRVMDTGHLEHLYYGKRLKFSGLPETLTEKTAFVPGNTIPYSKQHPNISLEDVRLEVSSYGRGDIREPFVEIIHEDGSYTSDFLFASAAINKGGEEAMWKTASLPCSYDEQGKAMQLCVELKDGQYGLALRLYYTVYEDCDVITRRAVLHNESRETVRVMRLMSMQLDLDMPEYVFTHFNGAWAREMCRTDVRMESGKQVNASYAGVSSNRANPFVMLSKAGTTEEFGDCYGISLVYSGNHYEAAEVNSYGKTRLVAGINPQSFCFQLAPEEELESPEAAMVYSCFGFNGMSQCMHRFVKEHIVRGFWKKKVRPILLNSWEAAYFNFNEAKLLRLAKEGKRAGIELFVLDDGWFGKRNDDTCSLGDWESNEKKLPHGLDGLCSKIKAIGLKFGIWVEPEMVSADSDLYRTHPDWTLEIPDKPHSEGRNQRVLDLTRTEVQDFIIEKMSKVFSSTDISYVKWDMNRIITDYFSQALPAERQGEVAHRYVVGLYRCLKELTGRFPKILFEGCASGGNRFDLGMLCYFPQIWASDDTDALCRAEIQTNYTYGYPPSVISAHISSCPNHQTLRRTPLETRFCVAAFGVLGYECNFCDMPKEELAEIKIQISFYKEWREVFQQGRFYRDRTMYSPSASVARSVLADSAGNCIEWTCVSKDKKKAVGMLMHQLAVPNAPFSCYYPKGLHEEYQYHFTNRQLKYSIKDFGDLVNMVSLVHIRQDSLLQNVAARFVKLDGETEDYLAGGDVLMYGGVHLKQNFAGTGYNQEVRYFPDFGARIYFMEKV